MATESKFKMSRERYEELQKELEYMQTVRTNEVSEQIKEARSYGDLSENSEYDEAKEEQGKLYSKIAEYQNLLANAEIVEAAEMKKGVIGMGSKVTVLDLEFKEEFVYQIVGSQEADPKIGRISDDSPLGRAIVGQKKGKVVTVPAPDGDLKFEIVDVK